MQEKLREEISSQLISLREENDYSQVMLAKRLGITRSTLANWEQGRREIGIEDLLKIYDLFNVDVNEYFEKLRRCLYR